ncbi:MAG: D-aminoacyl-tRNA deacylase [Acidobacteriota bacterium]
MRAVIQRVEEASVKVDDQLVAAIPQGLLVLIGVERDDGPKDLAFIRKKILNLRLFDDPEGKMNRSVTDIGGSVLAVPQFTLHGDCRKGNRPSYSRAASPDVARPLYELLVRDLRSHGLVVESGRFQALMQVALVNSGPVTLILDSRWKRS